MTDWQFYLITGLNRYEDGTYRKFLNNVFEIYADDGFGELILVN